MKTSANGSRDEKGQQRCPSHAQDCLSPFLFLYVYIYTYIYIEAHISISLFLFLSVSLSLSLSLSLLRHTSITLYVSLPLFFFGSIE